MRTTQAHDFNKLEVPEGLSQSSIAVGANLREALSHRDSSSETSLDVVKDFKEWLASNEAA